MYNMISTAVKFGQNAEYRLWGARPMGISPLYLLYLSFREHPGKVGVDTGRARKQEICFEVTTFRYDREVSLIESQQYGCLHKTQTMPVAMPMWMGKFS